MRAIVEHHFVANLLGTGKVRAVRRAALIFLLLATGPAKASVRAVIVEVQGDAPALLLETMTARWRADAQADAQSPYVWVASPTTLAGLQVVLDCGILTESCWRKVGKRLGVEFLFVAYLAGSTVIFERIDTESGFATERDGATLVAGEPARLESFVAAGLQFVRGKSTQPSQSSGGSGSSGTPVSTPVPSAPPPAPPKPELFVSSSAVTPHPSALSRVGVLTWTSAAATMAFLAGGVAMGLAAESAQAELNQSDRSCVTAEEYDICRTIEARAENRALVANVLFALGGATAVATGVLAYFDIWVQPEPKLAGATVGLVF